MRQVGAAFAKLFTATLIGQLIGFLVLAVIARRLGPGRLGAYGFAINFVGYFVLPVAGIGYKAVRDVARDKTRTATVSGAVIPILAAYTALVCALIYFLAPALSPTGLAATVVRIVSLQIAMTLLSVEWVLQGLQAFAVLSIARVSGQVIYGVSALLLVTATVAGLYWYAWLNMLGLAVTVAIAWIYLVRKVGIPRMQFGIRRSLRIWRESLPFTLSLVMLTVYYSIDFVLLGFLSTSRNVGQYVVAYKLPAAFLGLASVWVGVFYPHAASESTEALRRQVGVATTFSLVVLIPLFAGSVVLGSPLMITLFGAKYAPAATYFKILMLSALLGGIDANMGQILLARNAERQFAVAVGLGAVLNCALDVVLIPSLGPTGPAIATVAAEIVILMVLLFRVTVVIGRPPVSSPRVLAALLSSLVMVGSLLFLFGREPVLVRVGVGAAIFVVSAALTGAVRKSDIRYVRATAATS